MWIRNDNDGTEYYSVFDAKPSALNNYNHIDVIHRKLCPNIKPHESVEVDIVVKGDIIILNNYTEQQLKAELDKRKLARKEELEKIPRCRHCAYFKLKNNNTHISVGHCTKKIITYKSGASYYRTVNKSAKACDIFKHKDDETVIQS